MLEVEKEKINIIIKAPGQKPRIGQIRPTLEEYKYVVYGNIESIPFPGMDDVDIVVNDMGKLLGLPKNIVIPEYGDILMGTIFFIGVDEKTCTWKSMPEDKIEKVLEYLEKHDLNK